MPKPPTKPGVLGLWGGGWVAEADGLEGRCVPQDLRAEGQSPRGWAAAMVARAELQSVRGGGHEVAHTQHTGLGTSEAPLDGARLSAGNGLCREWTVALSPVQNPVMGGMTQTDLEGSNTGSSDSIPRVEMDMWRGALRTPGTCPRRAQDPPTDSAGSAGADSLLGCHLLKPHGRNLSARPLPWAPVGVPRSPRFDVPCRLGRPGPRRAILPTTAVCHTVNQEQRPQDLREGRASPKPGTPQKGLKNQPGPHAGFPTRPAARSSPQPRSGPPLGPGGPTTGSQGPT